MLKISQTLLDQSVKGPVSAKSVYSAPLDFKKAVLEHAFGAEMSQRLGYPAGANEPDPATHRRNGKSVKTLLLDGGRLRIKLPLAREAGFKSKLVGNRTEPVITNTYGFMLR